MDALLFLIFATIAVVCGINVVVQRQPIASALSLIGVMVSLAVIYLLLGAQFLAAAQVIVYAGAIMVLFVFVIMLLNAGAEKKTQGSWMARLFGAPMLALLLGLLSYVIWSSFPGTAASVQFGNFTAGTTQAVGRAIFTSYLLPFELTSVLVLIAIAGAVVLAYKELE